MAGATIEITVDDAEVRAALAKLNAAAKDMTPLMEDIGEHLLNTTRVGLTYPRRARAIPRAGLRRTPYPPAR